VSKAHDVDDAPIPLLTDTLVPGNALRARPAAPSGAVAPDVTPAAAAPAAPASAVPAPAVPASSSIEGLSADDTDALVERLSGRCLGWLTGAGREVIEARCSAALTEHAHWLVGQVSREIGLALETELKGWVKDAVREELAARAANRPSSSGV
jgi:hypothetical protein